LTQSQEEKGKEQLAAYESKMVGEGVVTIVPFTHRPGSLKLQLKRSGIRKFQHKFTSEVTCMSTKKMNIDPHYFHIHH
jgi:hypothetical protein